MNFRANAELLKGMREDLEKSMYKYEEGSVILQRILWVFHYWLGHCIDLIEKGAEYENKIQTLSGKWRD